MQLSDQHSDSTKQLEKAFFDHRAPRMFDAIVTLTALKRSSI